VLNYLLYEMKRFRK